MMISWTHDSQQLAWPPPFDTKVEIFYHRVLGWQLHVADLVSNGGKALSHDGSGQEFPAVPHAGFAVLQICLSYFETIGQYQRVNPATTTSTAFFKEGVHAVFPQLGQGNQVHVDAFLTTLYKRARCGLYHSSMTGAGIGLGQPGHGIAMAFIPANNQLIIDPHVLPKALKAHLDSYRDQLLDPNNVDLRQKFETKFNQDNGI
jgi:hypothetical protein